MLACQYCSKECHNKNSQTNHEIRCKNNPERRVFPLSSSVFKPGNKPWSKGLSKDSSEILFKRSEGMKGIPRKPVVHTIATKTKLSKIAKARGLGGYQKGSGRGKSGWYRGYYCDSSYELAWVIYNLDHDITFKRNTTKFPYEYNNKQLRWIPDFINEAGIFVEIKGYMTDQVKAKLKDFPYKIEVLMEKDLTDVFKYVINKHGKDFTKLYEVGAGKVSNRI